MFQERRKEGKKETWGRGKGREYNLKPMLDYSWGKTGYIQGKNFLNMEVSENVVPTPGTPPLTPYIPLRLHDPPALAPPLRRPLGPGQWPGLPPELLGLCVPQLLSTFIFQLTPTYCHQQGPHFDTGILCCSFVSNAVSDVWWSLNKYAIKTITFNKSNKTIIFNRN